MEPAQTTLVDMSRKGRYKIPNLRGEDIWKAKLTADDVRTIRSLKGKVSREEIAVKYGIGKTHVNRIQRREGWKHVE